MNIFNVLSMGKSRLHETSMSAMLSYLLSPYQDHGLGNIFLRNFLDIANKNKTLYSKTITGIDDGNIKVEIDLEVPYVFSKKRNDVDIQIKFLNRKNQEIHRLIIENKIRAGAANSNQLKEYYEAVLNDKDNDDSFDLDSDNLSVIFLTPDVDHKGLKDEFVNLGIDQKTWMYWSSRNNEQETIVELIKMILEQEQKAEISPINDYMRHTLKAFAYFINMTINITGQNRVGEDIGNIKNEKKIKIGNVLFTLILRDSGQIQLLDNDGEKVKARPLLRKFMQENNVHEKERCLTTRCFGKQIFDFYDQKVDIKPS